MTDDAINLAIAEWCGWKPVWECPSCHTQHLSDSLKWCDRCKCVFIRHEEPSYCTDLNAMWEAECKLHEPQRTIYINTLYGEECADNEWRQIHATARQRAEALLKTVGLWKE